jgi:hypothetical protein
LKLLSVAEVGNVDSGDIDRRVRAAMPEDLLDERGDMLCSSGRDHPDVKAKTELIVTLEMEIAFHKALQDFHGGVQTSASKQSAESAMQTRLASDKKEAERRALALGFTMPELKRTTDVDGGEQHSSPDGSPIKRQHSSKIMSPAKQATSPNAQASSPLRSATPGGGSDGRRSPRKHVGSSAFASKLDRFADTIDVTRAPPVGHYRPRHTVVEPTAQTSKISKTKRVLNAANESPYVGDHMTPQEREMAILTASLSPRRQAERLANAMTGGGTLVNNGSFNLNASCGLNSSASKNASMTFRMGGNTMMAATYTTAANGSGVEQTLTSDKLLSSPTQQHLGGRASPAFINRGRDAPILTRASGAHTPASEVKPSRGHSKSHTDSRQRHRSNTPNSFDLVNESSIKPRGPSAFMSLSRQLGRDDRVEITGHGVDLMMNTALLPLRDGDRLHRAGGALSFGKQASREQAQRGSERRAEDVAQRFYDRSALDTFHFRSPVTVDFGKSPSREQHRSGVASVASSPLADSHLLTAPIPDKAQRHTPAVSMDRQLPRPPIELENRLEISYDPNDDYTRPNTRQVTINAGVGGHSVSKRSHTPGGDDQPRHLPSHEELDSPSVRRKLAQEISMAKQVDRAHVARGRGTSPVKDDVNPVDSDKLDRAQRFLEPHLRGDPRMSNHVSRNKREALAAPQSITATVDTRSLNVEPAQLPNMRLGYVAFGKMTERDRHAGNAFANEARSISRLFERPSSILGSPERRGRGGGAGSTSPAE